MNNAIPNVIDDASMRPGDFSPGNRQVSGAQAPAAARRAGASMRPGDFSPGNQRLRVLVHRTPEQASMRPGDFSPGNSPPETSRDQRDGGYHCQLQ